ncbi:MAG TPA: UDP-N-acetylmuramoyl-tripeptide--D-alanyl-D-alanine ligase [Trebonia sp.]|jgi:UDP-N-acetylmuramoyl-tripeptide--D-alanyl-D-alanine ligase
MIPLSVAEIARVTGGTVTGGTGTGGSELPASGLAASGPAASGPGDTLVTGPVVVDSRQAAPGALFAALPGERVDGHDYAATAVSGGAAAVLAARPLADVAAPVIVVSDVTLALGLLARAVLDRLPDATVVGITGSSGKTSTKDLTAQVVERLGPTVAPEGSLNNEIGLPLTVLRADEKTRYLVLEMSARGIGHISYLTRLAPPRIGAVLNVGRAHAGEFGSVEAVARAKGELVEALPAGTPGPAGSAGGVAVLNADDPRVAAMAARTSARVVTTSATQDRPADVRATGVVLDDLGRASFTLHLGGATAPVTLRLHGRHHVSNALAAAAVAAELGLDTAAIADALSAATARSGKRMELTRRADGVLVVNDAYNANPDSTRAAIEALAHLANGGRRGIAVLGYMAELGDIAAGSHEEAGRLAATAGAAVIVAVGDGAAPVLDGARATDGWHGEAVAAADAQEAVTALRGRLRPGDVVLVKASKSAGLWLVADGLLAEVPR